MWLLVHLSGCGRPAFRLHQKIHEGEEIRGLQHLDGRPFVGDNGNGCAGEVIDCDSCGEVITRVDWVTAIKEP